MHGLCGWCQRPALRVPAGYIWVSVPLLPAVKLAANNLVQLVEVGPACTLFSILCVESEHYPEAKLEARDGQPLVLPFMIILQLQLPCGLYKSTSSNTPKNTAEFSKLIDCCHS